MTYVVAVPFTHLGHAYAPGDAIEPKPALVGQLVASGCIKAAPPPPPATTALDGPSGYVPPKVEAMNVSTVSARGVLRPRVSLGD